MIQSQLEKKEDKEDGKKTAKINDKKETLTY